MQLPFNQQDIRFISVDGNTVRFDLQNGHCEVTFDSPEIMARVMARPQQGTAVAPRHSMYQEGIYGL